MEIPIVSRPVASKTSQSGETKIPLQRYVPAKGNARTLTSDTDEKSPSPRYGASPVYSLSSLKTAALYQAKLAVVAESNIMAASSVTNIPAALLGRFRD